MSRFANLSDRAPPPLKVEAKASSPEPEGKPPSRVGRKAIAGYFSPEMSLAMHTCARRNGMSLQDLMAEAFDDVLRKYGESPVGK
ncbi:MAG: ribbon-helix-helix domain-containing protein [Pseudomonadota bacterium]